MKRNLLLQTLMVGLLLTLLYVTPAITQWSTVPNFNNAICTAASTQDVPNIVSDGSGGAIITWEDRRGSNYDIYAQRVTAAGLVQWTASGDSICTATADQQSPVIASDGSGGAIITWCDGRSSNLDIYAQKVDVYGHLGNVAAQIARVKDVINDQGGKVTVSWSPSYVDVYPNTTIKSYYLFRGVSQAMEMKTMKGPGDFLKEVASGTSPKNMLLKISRSAQGVGAYYWEYIDSVRALRLPGYSYTMPTVSDSGPQGTATCYAMVMARTSDELTYWFSVPDSGYSVDNLPPSAVLALAAQPEAGSSVNVHWSKDITDPDVGYYEIHCSTTNGFTVGPTTKIGQTSDTMLVDASPSSGAINYYRVVTVDIHGNKSAASPQASAGVMLTNHYGVANKWNLVSVPLTTSDYSKSGLFPTAVSSAFGYQGGYVVEPTLANGVGYWLKFNCVQAVPMTGLVLQLDSIAVQAGWNLIGSISSPIAVTGLGSSPGGIVSSQFFGYDGGYYTTDSIRPGKGYWVKVKQSGKLILASSGGIAPIARIGILPDEEKPPAPPSEEVSNPTSDIPNQFELQQNYPNPLNPTTVIRYQLPVASYVTLTVYNMLGQEVATLVNGMQEAGYKSVEYDASKMPSGVYFSKLTAGSFSQVRKMLLTK